MLKRNKYPEFCIITPTAYLERYASQSSMHLILAHLVDTDDAYANFYANRSEFKIMDNGAFELGESYDPDKLLNLAERVNADVIVLPDYPGEFSGKTIKAAERYIPIFKSAGFKTMFVPQSKVGDLDDWIAGYDWAADNDDVDIIGMSILGIPNAIPHIHKAYARVVMTHALIEQGIFEDTKYHHYLGLNAGPALEVPSLIKMNALDSIDSSGPVWAGILGHQYTNDADSYQQTKKLSVPVDFNYPLLTNSDTQRRIQHNIDMTLNLLK